MTAMYRRHLIGLEQAKKAEAQLDSMTDYLKGFVARLRELKVDVRDSLWVSAVAAQKAVRELSITVLTSARLPKRARWEWQLPLMPMTFAVEAATPYTRSANRAC